MTESIPPAGHVPIDPYEQAALTPAPDLSAEAARRLLSMSYTEWKTYQDGHYPGTQEIIETRQELLRDIEAFAAPDAPAARLFESLDPSIVGDQHAGRRLAAYERVCELYFDFRKGSNGEPRERQEIADKLREPREQVGEELWDATFEACSGLGMVANSELPDGDRIKSIGVLGGTPSAIANRTRYALEQLRAHGAATGSFDFLMSEGEKDAALKEAELQLGVSVDQVKREERPDGTVLTFAPVDMDGRQVLVRVLVAKAANGRTRATTLETMKLWGDVAGAQPEDRMVAVTTGLYTAFQNANAREVLTWNNGSFVDVIGHSAEWAGGERYANQLLQELKAAVDSKYRLYEKMIATGLAPEIPERYEVNVDALYEPIPNMDALREGKAGYTSEPIDTKHPLHNEPLVDVARYGIAGQAYYSRPNSATGEAVPDTPQNLFVRRSAAQHLQRINESLDSPAITEFFGGQVELYVEDAFRDIELQRELHDSLIPSLIRRQQPHLTEAEVAQRVREMIAVPSNNPQGPSPHQAGAFDIVLRYKQAERGYVAGANVPMGHTDGETSKRLYPDHFERHEPTTQADATSRHNRRGFYAIMTGKVFGIETGFVPNPTEWFHWSRGDQLWARVQRLRGREVQPYYSIAASPQSEKIDQEPEA